MSNNDNTIAIEPERTVKAEPVEKAPVKNERHDPSKSMIDLLTKTKEQFAMALPKFLSSERFMRAAITEIRKNPKLLKCSPLSVIGSMMTVAQLGLELGPLGQAYLIPYNDECQLQVGYKGLIALALRSDQVESISAHVVYENETFEVRLGTEQSIKHIPLLEGERGKLKAVYAVSKLKGGSVQFEVMTKEDVEKVKRKSKSEKIWSEWESEMWRKSAVKRLAKYLPLATDIGYAIGVDNEFGDQKNRETDKDAIEATSSPVDKLNRELTNG